MLRSRCRQHLLVKKTFDHDKLSTEPKLRANLTFVYHLLSKYDLWWCVRHSVTFILYLWSFLFTVLKSASYHKFGSKETKSFTTVHLSIAILSRRLFSNTMHSKQKGIFIFRMLSLSIVWDTCNRGKHNRNYRNIRNLVIFGDSR